MWEIIAVSVFFLTWLTIPKIWNRNTFNRDVFFSLPERDAFDTLLDHAPDKLNVVKTVKKDTFPSYNNNVYDLHVLAVML